MKRINLIISLLALIAVFSCTKDPGMKLIKVNTPGALVEGMVFVPITDDNDGGNITCEEVFNETGCFLDNTSERIDYDGGEGGTVGPITWTTDGTYVNWSSTVPVKIAVIVKGGPNASVYFSGCEDYLLSGTGLSAPINPNTGLPYGLSNITFCYSELELVIAVKSQLKKTTTDYEWNGQDWNYGVSSGVLYPFSSSSEWCSRLGYNYLHVGDVYELKNLFYAPYLQIGTISVTADKIGDEDCLIIEVDGFDDIILYNTWVYIGPELTGTECPDYRNEWEWTDTGASNTHTIIIPLDEI